MKLPKRERIRKRAGSFRAAGRRSAALLAALALACQACLPRTAGADDAGIVSIQTEAVEDGYINIAAMDEDAPLTESSSGGARRAAASVPSTYRTDSSSLTEVRNQGSAQLCWAYVSSDQAITSIAAGAESLTPEWFSPAHLAYSTFHAGGDDYWTSYYSWYSSPGNVILMTASTWLGWKGPVFEIDCPMPTASASSSLSLTDAQMGTSVSHLLGYENLPTPSSYTADSSNWNVAMRRIKRKIMSDGGVAAAMSVKSSYTETDSDGNETQYASYDSETNSYYSEETAANHEILLVGWDDEKETSADSPGAFLFKCTYGTGYGEDGYAWVSYYHASLKDFVCFDMEDTADGTHTDTIQHNYTGAGYFSTGYSTSAHLTGANVFTASQDEIIDAAGTYIPMGATAYVTIETGLEDGVPGTGTEAANASVYASNRGFYTASLSTPVTVGAGEAFAVIVRIVTASSGRYTIYGEGEDGASIGGVITRHISADAGESWISAESGSSPSFHDILTDETYATLNNLCITAYGNPAAGAESPTPTPSLTVTPTPVPQATPTPTPAEAPRYDDLDLDRTITEGEISG